MVSYRYEVVLELNEEQQQLIDRASELADTEFADQAFTWNGDVPWENIKTLADEGLFGINIDEEYGGQGASELEALLLIEAVGRVCPNTADFVYKQHMVGPRAVDMFGSNAVKEKYLPPITAGKESIAIAISEPDAGSDVASMTTTAADTNEGIVVNGEKTWVGNIPDSSSAVTWVKFEEGLGSIIIDLDADNIEVVKHHTNMAGFTQTHFKINDVTVPDENVLTRGRAGFKQTLKALNWERLGCAAYANAIAYCALDHALNWTQEREQFSQLIGDFQGIEWMLADMVKKLEAGRALTYLPAQRAAATGEEPERVETSVANLYTAEIVEEITSDSLQLFGARGYQDGHPLEYLYRVCRSRRIAAGTDEIQKNTIARTIKDEGLPKLTTSL